MTTNSNRFPHLGDTSFPNLQNINVFNYENNFDYTRWNVNTKIQLLNVPWDVLYENVVEFETIEERNKYIDKNTRETYTFETEQYLQPDGSIKIPIPFDVCQRYNYLVITFPKVPIEHGDDEPRLDKMFFFVMNANRLSPSTTELTIGIDYWQTFYNDFNVSYMLLERGHAPMALAPTPEQFLENPLENTRYLLTPDVNYGTSGERMKVISNKVFNTDLMYVVLAMSSDPFTDDWGTIDTDTMHIPGLPIKNETGICNYEYIAIRAFEFGTWLSGVLTDKPYILESVVSAFYCSGEMLKFSDAITMYRVGVHKVRGGVKTDKNFIKLQKQDFEYGADYERITKLYTSPYARLEIATDGGNRLNVNVEDVSSSVGYYSALNLVSGSVGIDCHLLQVNNVSDNMILFNNNGTNLKFNANAGWQNFMIHWTIPQFAIFSDQQTYQRWRRYWQNKQNVLSYEAVYANTVDTMTVESENSITVKSNTDYDRDRTSSYEKKNYKLEVQQQWVEKSIAIGNVGIVAGTEAQITSNNILAGSVQTMASVATGNSGVVAQQIIPAVSSLMSSGLNNISVSNQVRLMELAFEETHGNVIKDEVIGQWPDSGSFEVTKDYINTNLISQDNPNSLAGKKWILGNSFNNDTKNASNKNVEVSYNNSLCSTLGGTLQHLVEITGPLATETYSIEKADGPVLYGTANRSRDLSISAINTGNKDAELNASKMTGSFANCDSVISKPMGMFGTLITQSKAAIASAGDEMLRYGYYLNQSVNVNKLQMMKNFTYWKASDVWVTTKSNITSDAENTIKSIFLNGVTVWSDPSKIEAVSVTDNWI